jgi:hypothetical protein
VEWIPSGNGWIGSEGLGAREGGRETGVERDRKRNQVTDKRGKNLG